jgi:hypothetical protein
MSFCGFETYYKIRGLIDQAKESKEGKLSDSEITDLLERARQIIPKDWPFIVARNPVYRLDSKSGKTNDPIYIRRKKVV